MLGFCATDVNLLLEQLCVGRRRTKNRKKTGAEVEGPSVTTSPTLKPCLPPKGLDTPSQETAAKTRMTVYQPPCSRTSQFLTVKVAMEQPS